MECPKCNRDIPNGMYICPTCGYRPEMNFETPVKKEKKNYSFFFIVLGIILGVILITILVASLINKAGNNNSNAMKLSDSKPILIKENGLYGYIDSKGNSVITPKYKYAAKFEGNFAVVSEDYKNDGKTHNVHLIDATGKVFKTTTTVGNISYFTDTDTWFIDNALYNGNLEKINLEYKIVSTCNDKYCVTYSSDHKAAIVVDHAGNEVYRYQGINGYLAYDPSLNGNEFKNNYCLVILDNKKYGITNCQTGKLVYDFTEDKITSKGSNIFTVFGKNNAIKDHMYIVNDDNIYKTADKDVYLDHDNGTSYIKVHEHITETGELDYIPMDLYTGKILDEKPDDYLDVSWTKYTKIDVIKINDKYGLSQNGSTLVPVNYSHIYIYNLDTYKKLEELKTPYVLLDNNREVTIFNINDRKSVGTIYANKIISLTEKFIYYEDATSGNGVVYDVNTKKSMIINSSKGIEFNTNYFKVNEGNKAYYYNNDFDLIYEGESF